MLAPTILTRSSAFAFLGLVKTCRRFCVGLLALAIVGVRLNAEAIPAVDDRAKGRATAYQSEVRAQFSRGGWQIVREQPGRLVADHYLGFPEGAGTVMEAILNSNVSGVARVVITFEPETATTTACQVKAKRYDYVPSKSADGRYTLSKPHDIEAQNILEELAGMIGKARARLLATHPEYGAK